MILLTFAVSCLKTGGRTGGVGITAINLESSLPNGRWEGTGRTSSDGIESESEMILIIDDNEITEDFFTQGQSRFAVHRLSYVKKGEPQWLDQQNLLKGECQCFSKTCHCFSDDGQGTKHQMSLSFSARELNLEQSGEVNQIKYHNVYKLRIK